MTESSGNSQVKIMNHSSGFSCSQSVLLAFDNICPEVIKAAVEIIEEIISSEKD